MKNTPPHRPPTAISIIKLRVHVIRGALSALGVLGAALACGEPTRPVARMALSQPAFELALATGRSLVIASGPADQLYPTISGDGFAYVQPDNLGRNRIIVGRFKADGTTVSYPLNDDPGHQLQPSMSGAEIAFMSQTPDNIPRVTVQNLVTGVQTIAGVGFNPAISGENVVWESRNAREIHHYNLRTGTGSVIATAGATGRRQHPRISGDLIVYNGFEICCDNDVYLYDLSTRTETKLAATLDNEGPADISGDQVAFMRRGSDGPHVWVFDLRNMSERQISSGFDSYQRVPSISGNRVSWVDGPAGDILVYDLGANMASGIGAGAAEGGGDSEPRLSGDRIIYAFAAWSTGEQRNIHAFEFSVAVILDYRTVIDAVRSYLADGSIDNAGIAQSLEAFLTQAESADARGNTNAARNTLEALIRHVEAQSGRHITAAAAEELVRLARELIANL